MTDSVDLYEGKLIGLSVSGKNVSGLQERINITVTVTTNINVPVTLFKYLQQHFFCHYVATLLFSSHYFECIELIIVFLVKNKLKSSFVDAVKISDIVVSQETQEPVCFFINNLTESKYLTSHLLAVV